MPPPLAMAWTSAYRTLGLLGEIASSTRPRVLVGNGVPPAVPAGQPLAPVVTGVQLAGHPLAGTVVL